MIFRDHGGFGGPPPPARGENPVPKVPKDRPADFTLDTAWDEVVGTIEEKRSRTWATLLIPDRFLWVLRDHFGRHCHPGDPLDDGRVRVRVGAPTPRDIARTLSGWGSTVEVLDPPAVREELARIGAELTSLYAR